MTLSKIHHTKIQHKGDVASKTTPNRTYFWIWAEANTGRRIVWGPYNDYKEAERTAASKLNCPYDVVELRTRDTGEASRILRARLLNESDGDIETSFQRFSHKLPHSEEQEEAKR